MKQIFQNLKVGTAEVAEATFTRVSDSGLLIWQILDDIYRNRMDTGGYR
jgi:hypothetical protein